MLRKSNTQADVIEAFNNTSRYLNDICNIEIPSITSIILLKLITNKLNLPF